MLKTQTKTHHFTLAYLMEHISYRCNQQFGEGQEELSMPQPPVWKKLSSTLSQFIVEYKLSQEEILVLLLALAPHIQPDYLDKAFKKALPDSGNYPQIGGVRGKDFRGFLPTGETAVFLIAGDDLPQRFLVQQLFKADHLFAQKRILWLKESGEGEPSMSGQMVMNSDYIDLFTIGRITPPQFSMKFPAQLVETQLEWKDLVLPANTVAQIKELQTWLKHGRALMQDWGMERKLKPGYRVIFHGPPGTGKTLTASLLGKYTGTQVFKIDLSMVVSKFIGETEKNLANLFAKAEDKDWILFFDEADALFGKRTNVRDAHDKYANQEVSYLLQRVEHYNGMVILASNFKSNIDEAFIRRFQSIIHFPIPGPEERLQIWRNAFPKQVKLAEAIDLQLLARKYELSGSNIMNIVQYACLEALEAETQTIERDMLMAGTRKEFSKEGRML